MKVADIIKTLEEYDPNDSVVIAWWDRESFDPHQLKDMSADEWSSACEYMEEIDWWHAYDDIQDRFQKFLKLKK